MVAPVLAQIQELHPDDVRLVYRHFPLLSIHEKASLAGEAAEAAGTQGQFWSMHDILTDRYSEWAGLPVESFQTWLLGVANELELDASQFENDLATGRYQGDMQDAYIQALASGLSSTPTLFVNDNFLPMEPSFVNLEAIVRLELLVDRHYPEYPPMVIDQDKEYEAVLRLPDGQLRIQLYPQSAPKAVNAFVFLAREGWFDGNMIHLVLPETVVETGDPSATGFGDAGFHFENEIDPDLSFDQAGIVAMSSAGPNTNGSRFLITLAPIPRLNGTLTIFGRVVEGLDLLMDLEERDPIRDIIIPPQGYILSVSVVER